MYDTQVLAGVIYRVFLLSLIVAVLWAKGYLWWVFGIAIFLYAFNIIASFPIVRRDATEYEHRGQEEDEDEPDAD
jgi:hypothetical protein